MLEYNKNMAFLKSDLFIQEVPASRLDLVAHYHLRIIINFPRENSAIDHNYATTTFFPYRSFATRVSQLKIRHF
jgi:hypothetical protein